VFFFLTGDLALSQLRGNVKYCYLIIKIRKSKTVQYRDGDEVLISKGVSSACSFRNIEHNLIKISLVTVFFFLTGDLAVLFPECFFLPGVLAVLEVMSNIVI
jgi:hypothetical protein